jgi:hypothetical protein
MRRYDPAFDMGSQIAPSRGRTRFIVLDQATRFHQVGEQHCPDHAHEFIG